MSFGRYGMLRKIIKRLREGLLRDVIRETKWIYSYASQYKRAVLLFILLGITGTALGLASGLASKYLVDAVTGQVGKRIVPIAVIYVVCSFVRIVFSALSKRFTAKISIKASNEIRADVFARFMDVDWQASMDYHSGDLLSRVNSDVATVADSILGWIPSLVTSVVQLAATLAVILVYDPVMALIALASAPVTVLLSYSFLGKMRSFSRKRREMQAKLVAFYEESLQNLQAIKAFDLKKSFSGRLYELQAMYREVSLDFNLFSVRTNLLLSSIGLVVSCLCMGWGVYRLWSGYISFGTMVLFLQLAGVVSSTFSSLVALVPSAVNATVAAQRIMTILELPSEKNEPEGEAAQVIEAARENGVSVFVEDVHFAYRPSVPVFRGLSLEAGAGEIIGIVSPSGGGKTTLLRLLLGLISPSAGKAELISGGHRAVIEPSMRCLVTYVAQEKIVFSGTIAECLRMASPGADDAALEAALRASCAWDFVNALPDGLETPLGERGAGLSEGQIQRLAIARALLSPAPVMLLDEATSALDMKTERTVLDNILADSRRRTVIVTTHRPTVLGSCDRVYSIDGGRARILGEDEVEALLIHKDSRRNV